MTATAPAIAGITRQLAAFLAEVDDRHLPSAVRNECYRATLDWLGSALAGAVEPPARMAQQVAHSLGASDDATVFTAGRASAAAAALANGVAAHMLELDDVHKGSTLHAGAPVIAAALAVAERERASGAAFTRAVAIGYEAALRIGEAVNPSHYRYWHPTGTVATFGAAAAAGSLVRLTPARMLDALGTAGTQAAGLWEFNADGAMSKHLHPGKAAFNGILAADLAREGFTGATRILEGDRGFFRAMAVSADPTRITDALGDRWKIVENCYKLHSCCAHTHTAIDMALDIRERRGWSAAEVLTNIEHIEVETYAAGYEIVNEMNPATPYRGKFSLAYCVAVGLLEGSVGLDQFSDDRFTSDGVADGDTAALIQRVAVRVADDLTTRYPARWPTRITIVITDGTVERGASDYPRGNPENPVSTETLEQKFLTLVAPRYESDIAKRAVDAARALGSCDDVSRVVASLRRSA